MKPTKTQKIVIDAVIDQLQFLRDTNDIDSPTHYCDMDDWSTLDDCLSQDKIEELKAKNYDLFNFIKNLAI